MKTMKKNLFRFFGFILCLSLMIGCGSKPAKSDLSISDKSGTISISDYSVPFGNSDAKPIEEGLKSLLKEFQEATEKEKDLKGNVSFSIRCEADGLVRWITAGESNLSTKNEDELKNKLTEHMMVKQFKFPELGEVTMVEVTIKFE